MIIQLAHTPMIPEVLAQKRKNPKWRDNKTFSMDCGPVELGMSLQFFYDYWLHFGSNGWEKSKYGLFESLSVYMKLHFLGIGAKNAKTSDSMPKTAADAMKVLIAYPRFLDYLYSGNKQKWTTMMYKIVTARIRLKLPDMTNSVAIPSSTSHRKDFLFYAENKHEILKNKVSAMKTFMEEMETDLWFYRHKWTNDLERTDYLCKHELRWHTMLKNDVTLVFKYFEDIDHGFADIGYFLRLSKIK